MTETKMGTSRRKEFLACKLKNCLQKATTIIAGKVPNPKNAINETL